MTESAIGCEIRASTEVVEVSRTPDRDVPVLTDANAAGADDIISINRVEPYTDFDGMYAPTALVEGAKEALFRFSFEEVGQWNSWWYA